MVSPSRVTSQPFRYPLLPTTCAARTVIAEPSTSPTMTPARNCPVRLKAALILVRGSKSVAMRPSHLLLLEHPSLLREQQHTRLECTWHHAHSPVSQVRDRILISLRTSPVALSKS